MKYYKPQLNAVNLGFSAVRYSAILFHAISSTCVFHTSPY